MASLFGYFEQRKRADANALTKSTLLEIFDFRSKDTIVFTLLEGCCEKLFIVLNYIVEYFVVLRVNSGYDSKTSNGSS